MRVLVTGHRGYIGTVLVPLLIAQGHDVVGLDSGLFDECTFGSFEAAAAEITADVRDVDRHQLAGFEAVIHLAGLSNDPLGDFDPAITEAINCGAAVRLAALAREAGVRRFLFSSTCSVYGGAGDEVVDEESELRPLTPYSRSKARAEEGVAALADRGFSPVLLRSATAYGFSPRIRFDLVLNNFVAWALTSGCIVLKSDGTPWRPLVHVRDIAAAFAAALAAPISAVHGEIFNVGRSDENYRVRDIVAAVSELLPGCRVEYAPGAGPDRRCYRVSCRKIETRLPGFRPAWTIRRGAEEVLAACRRIGLRAGEFEGARYNRIEQLAALVRDGRVDEDLRWRERAAHA